MDLKLGRKKATGGERFVATPPRVDLLPAAYRARLSALRMRLIAVVGALGIAATVAGTWGFGAIAVSDLQAQVDDVATQGRKLSEQVAVFAPVTNLATQTDALNATIESQTSKTVDHAAVAQRFLDAVSPFIDIRSFQLTAATPDNPDVTCVSTDPFNQVPLAGCISFSGEPKVGGASGSNVLNALGADSWFSNPYLPGLSADGSLSGSVGLSVEAFSSLAPEQPGPLGLPGSGGGEDGATLPGAEGGLPDLGDLQTDVPATNDEDGQ